MSCAYADMLQAAIDAAQQAGEILRADFLKPGGPDGEGEHADADDRAEAVIRAMLLAATPEWSYRGEETGYQEGPEGHHVWLIDPNDATSAYLKGWRGSATSIGLLRDGVPVLGVVYAYAAPDNAGDFFAWAEGCGPLLRNGHAVESRPWPDALADGSVVIVSQAADRAPLENLRCVAPARYRTETSIAYRLALLAAGAGDACVCLSGAGDWDYAGGHALLRSGGGELVDQDGAPVRYTRDGRSKTQYCFGGPPLLVPDLARRDWDSAARAGQSSRHEAYDLSRPKRGASIADNDLLRRVQGCWLGLLTGNALGSAAVRADGRHRAPLSPHGLREIGPSPGLHALAGQPTDACEPAIVLARSLLDADERPERQMEEAYRWWLRSRLRDAGNAMAARHREPDGGDTAHATLTVEIPLAIWGHELDADQLAAHARSVARLTEANDAALDASATFAVALAATIREGLNGQEAYRCVHDWATRAGVAAEVMAALEVAAKSTPHSDRPIADSVLDALQNAFYQALHAESFEEGVVATVMTGGASDMNGAVAGALLGAIHGAAAIPRQWQDVVLTCRPQEGIPGAERPRPRAVWPVDALVLAERLAAPGRLGQ